MAKDKVAEYLQSEEGKMNAKRFIKALKEGRKAVHDVPV